MWGNMFKSGRFLPPTYVGLRIDVSRCRHIFMYCMCFLSSITGLLPWLDIWQHVYAAQNTQFALSKHYLKTENVKKCVLSLETNVIK